MFQQIYYQLVVKTYEITIQTSLAAIGFFMFDITWCLEWVFHMVPYSWDFK